MEKEPPSTGHLRLRSDASQRIEQLRCARGKQLSEICSEQERRSVLVVMHGEDLVERVFVRVDVDHPAKNDRLETTAGGFAGILRCNRTFEAELAPVRVPKLLALGRHTKIRVQMPHGDA